MARAMFSLLSRMFRWLLEKRRIKANPFAALRRPKAAVAREHKLSDDDIRKFWIATARHFATRCG